MVLTPLVREDAMYRALPVWSLAGWLCTCGCGSVGKPDSSTPDHEEDGSGGGPSDSGRSDDGANDTRTGAGGFDRGLSDGSVASLADLGAPACATNTDCGRRELCDPMTGLCLPGAADCETDMACGNGFVCDFGIRRCVGACSADTACDPPAACRPDTGRRLVT